MNALGIFVLFYKKGINHNYQHFLNRSFIYCCRSTEGFIVKAFKGFIVNRKKKGSLHNRVEEIVFPAQVGQQFSDVSVAALVCYTLRSNYIWTMTKCFFLFYLFTEISSNYSYIMEINGLHLRISTLRLDEGLRSFSLLTCSTLFLK